MKTHSRAESYKSVAWITLPIFIAISACLIAALCLFNNDVLQTFAQPRQVKCLRLAKALIAKSVNSPDVAVAEEIWKLTLAGLELLVVPLSTTGSQRTVLCPPGRSPPLGA